MERWMKNLIPWVLVPLFLIMIASIIFAAGGTARSGLEVARQRAQQWKSDAVLTGVSALNAAKDGTAAKWTYSFYSPKANMGYMVDIQGGKASGEMEVRPHIKSPVGSDFLDSPQAMEAALKNGYAGKGKPLISLLVMGQATANPKAYWTVAGPEGSVILEANTGRLLKKETY